MVKVWGKVRREGLRCGVPSFLLLISGVCVSFAQAQTPAASGTNVEFVKIQPGSFRMGCMDGDKECDSDENPAHDVRLTKPFEIGKYEVTQAHWTAVMNSNRSRFKSDNLPMENISYIEVQDFLKRLNDRNDGYRYRLPTEAEWEYVARAGTKTPNYGTVDEIAWYLGNSEGKSHPVGLKKPNAWGLHDMEGNVYEWTQDWYFDYESDPITDPTGPDSAIHHVARGGAWESTTKGIRTSNRNMAEPDQRSYLIGFRYVRVPAN